jgi:hypothetical protein
MTSLFVCPGILSSSTAPWNQDFPVANQYVQAVHAQKQQTWWGWFTSTLGFNHYSGTTGAADAHHKLHVVVVGVHGWALMGGIFYSNPQSISQQYCASMSAALQSVAGSQIGSVHEITVSGYGSIEQRVAACASTQMCELSNMSALQDADVIVFACHSQGVIVGTLLAHWMMFSTPEQDAEVKQERLFNLKPTCRVGICAMAGINHGPFPDTSSDFFSSTKELFQFNQPYASLSGKYFSAVQDLLANGVKIMTVASWMDQVVPLYSASLHGISSPNLVRALFVPSDTPEPSFFLRFVLLLFYLSNVCSVQNDLLVHLSGFIRGPLISRKLGSHSSITQEQQPYDGFASWFMSNPHTLRGVPAYIDNRSSVTWCQKLNDSFYNSQLNGHFIMLRFSEILALTKSSTLAKAEQAILSQNLDLLRAELKDWNPKAKNQKNLKSFVEPLLTTSSSKTDDIKSSPSAKL